MDTGASWEISKKNIYQLSFRCQNACNLHQFEAIFIQNINSVNVFLYFFNAAWFSVFAKIICCKGVNYSRAGDTNRSKNWEIMRRRRNQKIHFSNMGPPLFHHNNSHYTVQLIIVETTIKLILFSPTVSFFAQLRILWTSTSQKNSRRARKQDSKVKWL